MILTASDRSTVIGAIAEAHFHAAPRRRRKGKTRNAAKAEAESLRRQLASETMAGDIDWTLRTCLDLADLGVEYREEAALAVEDLLEIRDATPRQHHLAAESLERGGSRFHDEAARHLWAIIGHADSNRTEREMAVRALMVIGHDYYTEAERRVPELASQAKSGVKYRELITSLREGKRPPSALWDSGDSILYTLEELRGIGRASDAPEEDPGYFTKKARERRKQARESLAQIAGGWDHGIPFGHVIGLVGMGPEYREKAERCFMERLPDNWECRSDASLHAGAGVAFTALGPSRQQEAVSALLAALSDAGTIEPRLRRLTAHVISRHGGEYLEIALSALRWTVGSAAAEVDDRIDAAFSMAVLSVECAAEAARELRAIAEEESIWVEDRVRAARVLEGLGGKHREEARQTLHAMLTDQNYLRLRERAMTVDAIVQLGFA
ncbi:hypothetical protein [Streptomyces sp. NBC_00063]|uniref:hypothetical protein n=1 Tax=Streptomyces sp. NBC_00063 TaxID=2975638 RepID=UPI003D710418